MGPFAHSGWSGFFDCPLYEGSILRPSSLLDSPTSLYPLPSLRSLLSHGCVPLDKDGGLEIKVPGGLAPIAASHSFFPQYR